jgi:ribosomal protein S18 acetylase RimI-like enzyme
MISFRTFRNTDPPILSAFWRSRAEQLDLYPDVTTDVLEQSIFAKLYFDYPGMILAFDGNRLAGFAHAGFGANDQGSAVSTEMGTTCLALVEPGGSEVEVLGGLVERSEAYLRGRGAKVFYGGCMTPLNPFYLGLYGGSEMPGILDIDQSTRAAFAARDYREIERTRIMRLDLSRFESVIDRQQMQIRRQMVVESQTDAGTRSWWEACTLGEFELTRFEMVPRLGGPVVASALFRSMSAGGTKTGDRTVGLVHFEVDADNRRRGYAVFLLSEAFRQFQRQGILSVETQTPETNVPAVNLYAKMKFEHVGGGGMFRKEG